MPSERSTEHRLQSALPTDPECRLPCDCVYFYHCNLTLWSPNQLFSLRPIKTRSCIEYSSEDKGAKCLEIKTLRLRGPHGHAEFHLSCKFSECTSAGRKALCRLVDPIHSQLF